ncbi:MAG: hypothetical protein WDZ41_01705 [Candidatus Babeliales bacterium]
MNKNIFGTDGIRGIFGKFPFTSPIIIQLGNAIGKWIIKKYGSQSTVLLGHDTRISCATLKTALQAGLLLHPLKIYDTQIVPSPALASILKNKEKFNCAIMISASHNPYYDNGIKIMNKQSGKLSASDEETITKYFLNEQSWNYNNLGSLFSESLQEVYIEHILSYFPPNFLKGKKIVLDCAHGATYIIAPQIFEKLGAQVIPLSNTPNGLNINKKCGTLYPNNLRKAVIQYKADIGFAFDGDGDRVIAVNAQGDYKNGDDILALLLSHPQYIHENMIVGTIMTNKAFEIFLKKQNKILMRTQVGDKYITEQLLQHNLYLGGEPSGHIIMRDYLPTGDGIFTTLRILETIYKTNNWEMITFSKFPQIQMAIPVNNKKDLDQPPFSDIITTSKTQLHEGRLVIRYSGTEPVLRIMVEDDDSQHAEYICTNLSKKLQQELS